MRIPIGDSSIDAMLQRAFGSYRDNEGAIQALRPEKLKLVQDYDVPGMESAAAIFCWGPSGAKLLASYFDSHDDVLMLPMFTSSAIYPFFEEYKHLSVWEKLVAYPAYSDTKWLDTKFFVGDYSIAAPGYYAAIQALFAVYGDESPAWLEVRQRFFQFLHVAYAAAIPRRRGNPKPLMIFAPHTMDDALARQFIQDFPSGRFIHTIRDPISVLDSCFDTVTYLQTCVAAGNRPDLALWYLWPAFGSVEHILNCDRPHFGMEARTCAVRFEDMHRSPEAMMRGLADWLGILYDCSLLESTWNGAPYVNHARGVSWCGPNPANTKRRWKNLDLADRLLVFALLHENFMAWNYPSRRVFRRKWIRVCIIAVLWLLPMKMEIANTRMVVRLQAIPALLSGRIRFACRAPFFLITQRLRIMSLIASQARARLSGNRRLLTPL
jgi:hypothetical protein